jgi:RNA polymerase sigma-70 factor (ECF subfamily)
MGSGIAMGAGMHELETRMGGSGESFPNTTWASLFAMTDAASAAARQAALSKILERYWRPVYAFVRASAGKSVEDAKDLTQAFFTHMIEDDLFAKYVRERGRFRDYLKGALRNFLLETHRSNVAQKRGGGRMQLPLDVAQVETEAFGRQLRESDPGEMFDRQWARDLLVDALQEMRRALEAEGRGDQWRVYEAMELSSERPQPSYEDLARRFELSTHEVKNALFAARGRLHRTLRERISTIVTSERELREEMKHLFGSP